MRRQTKKATPRTPGSDEAEYELKKAYNHLIEIGVSQFWDRAPIYDVDAHEVEAMYRRAFDAFRDDDRLSAGRWARSAKHLARAIWHEAKIAYLEPRQALYPYLENALAEYGLDEYSDTTEDLVNSVAEHVPPGMSEMPEEMKRYLSRARKHLAALKDPGYQHELSRAERIKAAYEYGRVLECLALAYEAQFKHHEKIA